MKKFLFLMLLLSGCAPSLSEMRSTLKGENLVTDDAVYQKVKEAFDKGAKPNEDGDKWPPMLGYCEYPKTLELIAQKGGNPNAEYKGVPLLSLVVSANKDDLGNYCGDVCIDNLIKNGADPNKTTSSGISPLAGVAFLNINKDSVQYAQKAITKLIKSGAKVNAVDKNNNSPLIKYAAYSSPEMVQTLINNGAKVNFKGNAQETPLMFAATYNEDHNVVQTLIKNGADVNAKDTKGYTAVDFAFIHNHIDSVRDLINGGAKVDLRDLLNTKYKLYSDTKLIKKAVSNGSDVNIKYDDKLKTPLVLSASCDTDISAEVIKILVEAGADVYAKDGEGDDAFVCLKGDKLKVVDDYFENDRKSKKEAEQKKVNDDINSLMNDKLF